MLLHIGVAPITQLDTCVIIIVDIPEKSPNVEKCFPYHKGLFSISKRDAINDNHSCFQKPLFVVR